MYIMDSSSVVSEPISHHRSFSKHKSASMTVLSPKHQSSGNTKYSQLDNLESKMSNIEVSLNSTNSSRSRRKCGSLNGVPTRTSSRSEAKELRSALQDREAVIQNLRIQLCLGKLPRPSGPPLDESERPVAEQKLNRLKGEAENKRIAIRNLKSALDKLDITDNIDIRIRQAELEYALGREELQLLSIVEEVRALQSRLDKAKPESNSLFNLLSNGVNLTLHAVQATVGRWAANTKSDSPGLFIEWALDGEGLYRGDRIIEVNGKLTNSRSKEDLQKQVGNSGKCQLVLLRKKSAAIPQKQLVQQQEDNLRLQHRISYLEEQVKELQTTKDTSSGGSSSGHVTSISISSPPSTPPDKPVVYQRGNYITTLVGGKPIELTNSKSTSNVTKTLIKENGNRMESDANRENGFLISKSLSASKVSISSDIISHSSHRKERERRERHIEKSQVQRSTRYSEGMNQRNTIHARSVEHLNQYNGLERRREALRPEHSRRISTDMRSVKSLDFDSENDIKNHVPQAKEYSHQTEPRVRPTPPKKPLRLSLQRAQSLQTVELNANELDKKRPLKRAHYTEKCQEANLIENCSPFQTASLGRPKNI